MNTPTRIAEAVESRLRSARTLAAGMAMAWAAAALLPAAALGQQSEAEEPSPPATQPAGAAEELRAEVVEVEGVVRKCQPLPEAPWEPVAVGETLGEKVLLRTGLGSRCVLKIGDRGRFLVRAATKTGIGTLARGEEKVTANLGLKYGSVQATVDPQAGQSDFSVSTALATAALRGSQMNAANAETGPGFSQNTGRAEISYGSGLTRRLEPGAIQTDGTRSPAQLLVDTLAAGLGDVNGGLTPGEREVLANYFSGGDAGSFVENGSVGGVDSPASLPDSRRSEYLPVSYLQVNFSGSGTFTDPLYSESGSGGYGTWTGSGTYTIDGGANGDWTGSGAWTGVEGSYAAEPTNFAGSGTWRSGNQTGSFVASGRIGSPGGAQSTTDQGEMTFTASGPATIVTYQTDSP